jgi:hypothetical protein
MHTAMAESTEHDVTVEMRRHDEEALELDVTHCRFAEFFRALGEPELGALLICETDFDIAAAGGNEVSLTRDQTIMQGRRAARSAISSRRDKSFSRLLFRPGRPQDAVRTGVRVIATTRDREHWPRLENLGAERCEIERRDLSKHIAEAKKIDAVLDLVGNTVMLDSLAMLRRGGRSCLAGWLGGLDPVPNFNPLLQMASGVYLTFFASFVFGTPGFPLSDVPLQQIAADAAAGRLDVKPVRTYRFEEISEAHRVMEANLAGGKMVVVHD